MKKFLLLVMSVLLLSSIAVQTISAATVAFVKTKAGNYDNVTLQGKITAQVDDDEYILADGTGSIKIELEDQAEYALRSTGRRVVGAQVSVTGVVDKDYDDPTTVKVFKIRIIG